MKKFILAILALMVSVGMISGTFAEVIGPAQLEGVIAEVNADGSFLLDSISQGQVLVHADENTVLEGVMKLAAGQYVFVFYTGSMAESLTLQVTAQKVGCHVFEGTILSLDEYAKTALVESEAYGQVQVLLPEMEVTLHGGDNIAVYFSGVMALSYPAQAGGLKVDVYQKASGTVTDIGDGYFVLDAQTGALRVNMGEETIFPDALEIGDEVTVLYNGQMVVSIPSEIFGLIIQ